MCSLWMHHNPAIALKSIDCGNKLDISCLTAMRSMSCDSCCAALQYACMIAEFSRVSLKYIHALAILQSCWTSRVRGNCRDAEEADIEKERKEQAKGPAARAHELEELTAIYEDRGLSHSLARQVRIHANTGAHLMELIVRDKQLMQDAVHRVLTGRVPSISVVQNLTWLDAATRTA